MLILLGFMLSKYIVYTSYQVAYYYCLSSGVEPGLRAPSVYCYYLCMFLSTSGKVFLSYKGPVRTINVDVGSEM